MSGKESEKGVEYVGIFTEAGKVVDGADAFDYAMYRCGLTAADGREIDAEFKKALCDWFYSGDWLMHSKEMRKNELFN